MLFKRKVGEKFLPRRQDFDLQMARRTDAERMDWSELPRLGNKMRSKFESKQCKLENETLQPYLWNGGPGPVFVAFPDFVFSHRII